MLRQWSLMFLNIAGRLVPILRCGRFFLLPIFLVVNSPRLSASDLSITIDGSQTNQLIEGFGVNANYWSYQENDLQPVLDSLIDELGITQFRVIMNNGWEAANDNGDPADMNSTYFNAVYNSEEFQKLWGLLRYLNQKGVTNGIMLNFQGGGPSWMGGSSLDPGMEDEWAEMIVSLLLYARTNQSLAFNLLAPNNEPDLGGEGMHIDSAAQYLDSLHSLARKLDSYGLSDIRLVGPDLSEATTSWLPELFGDAVVMNKLAHCGTHNYSAYGGEDILGFINSSAWPDRSLWVTEYAVWCTTCEDGLEGTNNWEYALMTADYLLGQIRNGASAAFIWEGYDSYYPHHGSWSFWGLFGVDSIFEDPLTYTPRLTYHAVGHYSKFVRPGARCLATSLGSQDVESQAFYHDGLGQLTIVGINRGSEPASLTVNLQSLPDFGTLHLYCSSADALMEHTIVPVISGACVFTLAPASLYTLTATNLQPLMVSAALTNPVDGQAFDAPANVLIEAAAATGTGSLSSVTFYADNNSLGTALAPPWHYPWPDVPPGNHTLTLRASNSVGDFALSAPVRISVAGAPDRVLVTPVTVTMPPGASQQFHAAVFDTAGIRRAIQPLFDWSIPGGGSVDSNGLFTAPPFSIGPLRLAAHAPGLTGRASIMVSTNIAQAGIGFGWYGLENSSDDAPRAAAAGVNDRDEFSTFSLVPGGGIDTFQAWEAAGVLWGASREVGRVVFINGAYDYATHDGAFSSGFHLQFTSDGHTWNDADGWSFSPSYPYDSPNAGGTAFTFGGPPTLARGVRCVGQVFLDYHVTNSARVNMREMEIYPPVAAPEQTSPLLDIHQNDSGFVISWDSSLTNSSLQWNSFPWGTNSWQHFPAATQVVGSERRVGLAPTQNAGFFRLGPAYLP